jgi:hypothetical protein
VMDDILELDTGESIDTTFWRDPERLRRAAAHYKRRAQNPPNWFRPPEPERVEPPQRSFADLLVRRVDDPFTEEDARATRTAIAMGEIRRAMREQEQQAAAQARKDLAAKRQQTRQAAGDVGWLMMRQRQR